MSQRGGTGAGQGAVRQGVRRGQRHTGGRVGDDVLSPEGGKGTPEEQEKSIVNNILNLITGGGPHSGQYPATRPRQPNHGARVRGGG